MTATSLGYLRLPTARLVLRPVEEADAAATAALVTPDVAANLSTWPSPMSVGQVLEKIHSSHDMMARREGVDLAIAAKDDDALIGWIGLAIDGPGVARLGYWLGAHARGRGLMKEAAAVVVPACADFLGVKNVRALVLRDNVSSIAVLGATGFEPTGEEDVFLETAGRSTTCIRFEWTKAER